MILQPILKKIESIPVGDIVRKAVEQNKSIAEDLNADQMNSGLNSKNQPITPEYTEFTKQIKRAKGQPTNRVTLRDEGDFHRSLFLESVSDGFSFSSNDPKAPDLAEKYGDDIFGLNGRSEEELSEQIKDDLSVLLKKHLTR